ncbi:DUF2793 domain-containing protein [Salinarimonas soli]|uniref:DUF2793 domain-containing protein n=1 Tax=Salinarimonas soli TaxID=1638099 RepID=A0A5B2VCP1_9HYPH|nr:DUF2793 domain-containing protein [Salinarimonas soli]KAA2237253.1 DUF2793 domain-containing protein [Salinarimonas soli]
MTQTPHLGLPLIAAGQAQKHVTHNEALVLLDALAQLAIVRRDLADPPGDVGEGARFIVGPAPTGAWAGRAGQVAVRLDGAWTFRAPEEGWIAYALAEGALLVHRSGAWTPLGAPSVQQLERLGLGTAADATNPFAARLNKALWTARPVAEGGDGDLRYTLNKEGPADVLSLLFQSGFQGRAELGLIGDDDLVLKVSADGSAWREALRVSRSSGVPRFPGAARFLATIGGDPAVPAGAWTRIPYDLAALNDGGGFDPATGRFTAPAAGVYRIDAAATLKGTGAVPAAMEIALHRNAIAVTGTAAGAAGLVDGVSGVATGAVLALDAGDAVEARIRFTGTGAAVLGARSRICGNLLP